jgi:murein DD-endopeptidase MepM/ murein hydrolase activator NlpD
MNRICSILLPVLLLLLASCNGDLSLSRKSRYAAYRQQLEKAGLEGTAMGKAWIDQGDSVLDRPQPVPLPYRETGYFQAEKPRAAGLLFSVKRGQKIYIQFTQPAGASMKLFAELWRAREAEGPGLIAGLDSTNALSREAERDERWILRFQPELLQSGEYTLTLTVGPSLAFPVAGGAARIGSFWGVDRDGGARRHEGIDIFAPKRTPVIAIADGRVTRVTENRLGGLVVFMRPAGRNYTLYYAHLDEQLVESGASVKLGDTLGLVGNTGNARSTPPHLHFGIYTGGGAIDPIHFVNPILQRAPALAAGTSLFREQLRLATPIRADNTSYPATTLVEPLAVSSTGYRVALPNGARANLAATGVTRAETPLSSRRATIDLVLQEEAAENSPRRGNVRAGTALSVLGRFNDFVFVQTSAGDRGWLPGSALN